MIGDGVNLASRLESACKQYSARILISEHTFGRLNGVYRTREVDHVIVKGKTEPVAVYEVLDYHTRRRSRTSWIRSAPSTKGSPATGKGTFERAGEWFEQALLQGEPR